MTSLQAYNTFGVNAFAEALIEIDSEEKLQEVIHAKPIQPFFILGGGSNVLFRQDLKATVLLNRIKGMVLVEEDDETAS